MTVFDNTLTGTTTDTTKNPSAIGNNKVNDWFVWLDTTVPATPVVRLCHGPDWTDNVTRSAGTALIRVNGILLNNAAITNGPAAQRGTYVGTTYSSATAKIDWTFGSFAAGGGKASLNLWNCYNRVTVATQVNDLTASHTYNTNVFAPYMGNTNNSVDFVNGLAEDDFRARIGAYVTSNDLTSVAIGIGFDVSNAASGVVGTTGVAAGNNANGEFAAVNSLGKHTIFGVERGNGATGSTFYGNTAGGLIFLTRM